MTEEERMELIELLVIMTGRNEGFYKEMTDERLNEEYDLMMVTKYEA